MVCELCGGSGRLQAATVDGARLSVCDKCANLSSVKLVEDRARPSGGSGGGSSGGGSMTIRRAPAAPHSRPRSRGRPAISDADLAYDYGKRVQKARSKLGMTQEDLARKLNEKKAIINKIESQQFRPDQKLINKLEKELGIELMESQEFTYEAPTSSGGDLTLGEFIRMEKK